MALREIRDRNGVEWKVWDVTPEQMHPKTAAEDFLGDYQEGWLCFESPVARRRLAPYPHNWVTLPEDALLQLLDRAQVAGRRRVTETTMDFMQRVDEGRVTPPEGMAIGPTRMVRDVHGRAFTVGVHRLPPTGTTGAVASSPGAVLRFTSGDLVLELERWPDDWVRYDETQLAALLERARPAERERGDEDQPLRRREDQIP